MRISPSTLNLEFSPIQQTIDLVHLVLGQWTQLDCPGIFLHLGDRAEARDGDSSLATAKNPCQRALRQSPSAAGKDTAESFQFIQGGDEEVVD